MDLKNWVREFAFRPRWAFYSLGSALRRRGDGSTHNDLVREFSNHVLPLPEALSKLLGVPSTDLATLLDGYRPPELVSNQSKIPNSWGASPNLLKVYYLLCRVLKPRTIVETGVATGVSSALLLRELADIRDARLISIEMPGLGHTDLSYIGSSVPAHLRRNWKLIVAPAVPTLHRMRDLVGKVDVFIHDSDHSYENQRLEYEAGMKLLAPGGVLVSDDVNNDAFMEICAAAGTTPVLVHRRENQSYIGLTRKTR